MSEMQSLIGELLRDAPSLDDIMATMQPVNMEELLDELRQQSAGAFFELVATERDQELQSMLSEIVHQSHRAHEQLQAPTK